MKAAVRAFAALCLFNIGIVSSQSLFQTCAESEIAPMANFKETRYNVPLPWYIQGMYVNEFVGTGVSDCYTTLRTPLVGGKVLMVDTIIDLNLNRTDLNRTIHYNGLLTFNKPGFGQFIYNSTDNDGVFFKVTIISTDYTNYSIEWSCWDVGGPCLCWLFVMSRDRSVTPTIQNEIDRVIEDHKEILDKTKLRKVKQDIGTCVLGETNGVGGLLGGLGGLLAGIGGLLGGLVGLLRGLLQTVGGLLSSILG